MIKEKFTQLQYGEVIYEKITGDLLQISTPFSPATGLIEGTWLTSSDKEKIAEGTKQKFPAEEFYRFNMPVEAHAEIKCAHTRAMLAYLGLLVDQANTILNMAMQRGRQMMNNVPGGFHK